MNVTSTAEMFTAAPAAAVSSRPAAAPAAEPVNPAEKDFGQVLKETVDRDTTAAAQNDAQSPAADGKPVPAETRPDEQEPAKEACAPVPRQCGAETAPDEAETVAELPVEETVIESDSSGKESGALPDAAAQTAGAAMAAAIVAAVVAEPLPVQPGAETATELTATLPGSSQPVPAVRDTALPAIPDTMIAPVPAEPQTAEQPAAEAAAEAGTETAVDTATETAPEPATESATEPATETAMPSTGKVALPQEMAEQPSDRTLPKSLTPEELLQQMRVAAHVQEKAVMNAGTVEAKAAETVPSSGEKTPAATEEDRETVASVSRLAGNQPVQAHVVQAAAARGDTASGEGRQERRHEAASAHTALKGTEAAPQSAAAVAPRLISDLINARPAETVTQPAVSAADPAEIVDRIVKGAEMASRNGRSEMVIRLEPENLGRMHLRISAENDVVSIQIRTESTEARDIIKSHLSQLSGALGDHGLKVDRASVSVDIGGQTPGFGSQGFGAYQGNGSAGEGSFRQFARSYVPDTLKVPVAEVAALSSMAAAVPGMTGSVNYLV